MKINPKVLINQAYELPQSSTYRYKLDILENAFPVHQNLLPKLKHAIDTDTMNLINKYPQKLATYQNLLNKIAQYVNVIDKNIIITNGSDSALELILNVYCTDDSTILIANPNYPHFIQMAENKKCRSINYIDVSSESDLLKFPHDIDLFYLSNPNLPLGYSVKSATIERLIEQNPDTMFVIDEAYFEYGTLDSCCRLIDNSNIIVTRTFSKAFGLAGMRVGYLITHQDNVTHLKVLHNGKSVTSISLLAAEMSISDLSDMQRYVDETNRIKIYLIEHLNNLTGDNRYIYGYNVQYGNFFLLFCRDTIKTTNMFYQAGVCVRNKHDDVPNSVRICITTMDAMVYCMEIVKKINTTVQYRCVLLDLDGTMRRGSKLDFYEKTEEFVNLIKMTSDLYVVTNNTSFTPEQIHDKFLENNIVIDLNRIVSPLTYLKRFTKDKNVYVIGNQMVKEYLNHSEMDQIDYVLFLNMFYINIDEMIRVCTYLQAGAKLFVSEMSSSCSLLDCSDVDSTENVVIPDIGAYVGMFKELGIEAQCIGKPNLLMIEDILALYDKHELLVIGNSIASDIMFAKNIGCQRILVGEGISTDLAYDFAIDTYRIDSINSLIAYLTEHELRIR